MLDILSNLTTEVPSVAMDDRNVVSKEDYAILQNLDTGRITNESVTYGDDDDACPRKLRQMSATITNNEDGSRKLTIYLTGPVETIRDVVLAIYSISSTDTLEIVIAQPMMSQYDLMGLINATSACKGVVNIRYIAGNITSLLFLLYAKNIYVTTFSTVWLELFESTRGGGTTLDQKVETDQQVQLEQTIMNKLLAAGLIAVDEYEKMRDGQWTICVHGEDLVGRIAKFQSNTNK